VIGLENAGTFLPTAILPDPPLLLTGALLATAAFLAGDFLAVFFAAAAVFFAGIRWIA
jgi:hypothetical protein